MPTNSGEYNYVCPGGVEPWKPVEGKYFSDPAGLVPTTEALAQFGGGHVETGQNLLAGVWTVTDVDQSGMVPIQGARLIDGSAIGNPAPGGIPGFFENGMKPFYDSRTSARIVLDSQPEGFTEDKTYFAVLSPPEALKQALLDSITWDPSDVFGVFANSLIKKSILSGLDWRALFTSSNLGSFSASGSAMGIREDVDVSFGTLVGAILGLPLLKTNGADGTYPEFFPAAATMADLADAQAIIDSGEFFIPMLFAWDQDGGGTGVASADIDIEWPHSIQR